MISLRSLPAYYLLWLCLLAAFLADQERMNRFVLYATVKLQIFIMDIRLYLASRLMHLKISRDLRSLGLEPPPFMYTPIEERSDV